MSNANAAKGTARLPPALNPEQPALTQPWRDFVSRGFTNLRVEFSGGMTNVVFDLGPQVKTPEGAIRTGLPAGAVKQYIIESKLWAPGASQKSKASDEKKGVQLPRKSLVPADFDRSKTPDKDLLARVTAVAEALTDTVARGRIGSLKFMRKGVDSFDNWWKVAPPSSKTRIVMDGKHHNVLTADDHLRFAEVVVNCPFRGPVPTPTEEEEAEEEQPRKGKQVASGAAASPPRK